MRLAHLSLLLPLLTPLTASTLVYSTLTSTITALPTDTPASSETWLVRDIFISTLVNTTNKYRSITSAPPLIWNATLASYAASYAQQCQFKHSGGPYGENLAEGYENVTSAVGAWGNERKEYKHGEGFSEGTGHWTQLVWSGTTDVGCAAMYCAASSGGSATGWYLVCEYYPPGNVEGQFAQEVGKVKYTVSGSGEAATIANKLVNAAGEKWTGMNRWNWAYMLGVVVLGLAF